MSGIELFATPWWVNALILVPAVVFLLSGNGTPKITRRRLVVAALFGIAFAFVEAAVVVYLRAAAGMLPSQHTKPLLPFPAYLMQVEWFREVATMVMLAAIAALVGKTVRQRFIAFFWTFAFWDLFYYVWLRVTIGWPPSLKSDDLLFLIPSPWISQVWFPVLVSSLTIVAVAICSIQIRPQAAPVSGSDAAFDPPASRSIHSRIRR